jgi:hypothetical protein
MLPTVVLDDAPAPAHGTTTPAAVPAVALALV